MTDVLDRNQYQLAATLFHELVALGPDERSARLSQMSTEPALRRAVEALLMGDAVADERLPKPGFGFVQGTPAADPLQLVGRTISHFQVGEPLGAGGIGVVYRAEDLQLRRFVALKFLHPHYQLSASSKERFLREARAAGALDHPNLCPVYEIGESSAGLFLAMPLYGGETLKDRLGRTGTIPVDEALAIASQIAAGLQYAHAAGIVHRDIKPGNVMLLADGTVKILDFGLAKVRAEPAISHAVLGTVSYMSPEQVRGDPVDARTDLWALGVMLYELLSGVRPFAREHEAASLHAIVHDSPRPVSELLPNVAPEVDALVHTLLRKSPDARHVHAGEVVLAIAAIRGGARLVVRGPARRIRWLAIAATAVLLAMIGSAYIWLGTGRSLLAKGVIAERDPLVVADFDISGSDSALGPILANALRRNLGVSSVVSVMPRGRVESALLRMRRPPGTRLTPAVAREVAQREGARAVVEGDLAQLGAGYLLTLRLVAASTGDALASFPATAARLDDLLPALDKVGRSLRREIGESLRDVRAAPAPRKLTTASLEALRLFDSRVGPQATFGERLARLREVVALDSTFAYAWLQVGNLFMNLRYRTAAQDSAFMMMYRLRDQLTPFERAQNTAFYWRRVGLDRSQAKNAYEDLLARDSTEWRAALNLGTTLLDAREFKRAETLLLRYERAIASLRDVPEPYPSSVLGGNLVDALVGQGRIAIADSLVASHVRRDPKDVALLRTRVRIALATLRLDTAAALANRAPSRSTWSPDLMVVTLAGIARTRGRLSEAHRLDAVADSINADLLRGTRFDPMFDRAVSLAAEELWLTGKPDRAVARLDEVFGVHPVRTMIHVQDRMDAVWAAALYAAAGRPERARSIIDAIMATSDSIARRAIHPLRYTALGEIALAEDRPREAMAMFRESDRAADGLPASRCAICILPGLARAAERAGWADSARSYWERYVTTPSLDRLETDRWFLAMGYRRLGGLYAGVGDRAKGDDYRAKLAELWRGADADLQRHTRLP
jgi:tetratricopeptide (TPR) repeat protein